MKLSGRPERGLPRLVRLLVKVAAWVLVSIFSLWAIAALYFDVRRGWLRLPATFVFVVAFLAILFFVKGPWLRLIACSLCSIFVLLWWLSLQPSNERPWQNDVSQLAWAEVHGDQVVIHNVRSCDYRTEFDYSCRWETRAFDLSQLRGLDAYIVNWGSPWIAHTMLSFQFGEDQYIAFSIETRKVTGQSYSAVAGFFRQYELIYIVSDERDVVRLRTNYRKGEDVYLYHLTGGPVLARRRFLEYVKSMNKLYERPEWYNAFSRNCTTSIFSQREAKPGEYLKFTPWDWQVLLNGKLDEFAYREGTLAGNLPFEELKRRAYINPAARAADKDPDFSRRIREGRPGFEMTTPITRLPALRILKRSQLSGSGLAPDALNFPGADPVGDSRWSWASRFDAFPGREAISRS